MSEDPRGQTEALEMFAAVDELQNSLAQAIGLFTMRFADLEGHMNWAIGCLLGLNERRTALLTSAIISVSARLDIYSALVSGTPMDDQVRERLRQCGAEIGRLNSYRNKLIHNRWGALNLVDRSASKVWAETKHKKHSRKGEWFSIDEIIANTNFAIRCTARLSDGINAHQTGRALEDC